VNHNTASTLFTNKTRELLAALQSPDSLTFSEAKTALNKVPFSREDLPLLHKAMLQRYRDSAEYNTANNSLFNIIGDLKDETTVETVKQCWATLPADKEDMRYDLLRLVAAHQTGASFSLVRDLLLKHRPGSGNSYRLFSELSDSLELVKPLLPDLLPLLKDSVAKEDIVSMVRVMLDSNLVDIALVSKYKKELYDMASAGLKRLQKKESDDYWYEYDDLIKVLVKLKDPVAFQWVRKMLVQTDIDVKHTAAIELLKSGQPVDAAEWLKLAADKSVRTNLYGELEGLKKTALFPKQYFTEKAFAESDLYAYASEDDEVKKITYVSERVVMYKGARKRFYLFSVDMSYEDEKIVHLGIAGPFGLKPAKPVINAAATGIKWDSNYKAATIDADLKAYLEERAKYDE
jgi:predicted nucleic acid-binding protein